jgi:HAD superfamily hydrolase (TIGR01509 family)
MLKAILFDLGDTLFDFQPMKRSVIFEQGGRNTYDFLSSMGHTLPPFKRYLRSQVRTVWMAYFWSLISRREFNVYDLLVKVCKEMKLPLDEPTMQELAWQWYSPLTEYTRVAPDVIPTLTTLRDRGFKLALVSNTFIPPFVLDRHLALHDLLEFFPHRIYSSAVGVCKPHPRIFEVALRETGVTAAQALFVGDVVRKDIVGAQRVGMQAVLRTLKPGLTKHRVADFVIHRISELHNIVATFDTPRPPVELPLEALVSETSV